MFLRWLSHVIIKFDCWNIKGFKLEKLENEHFYKLFDILVFLKVGQMLSQQWLSQDTSQ